MQAVLISFLNNTTDQLIVFAYKWASFILHVLDTTKKTGTEVYYVKKKLSL